MYTVENFASKAALKRAFNGGVAVEVYQPGGMFAGQTDGVVTLEGPHFPAMHTWYATATIADGVIVKIK